MNQFNEPWEAVGAFVYHSGKSTLQDRKPGFENVAADCGNGGEDHEAALAYAERISACVNALAGVPTEDIEKVVGIGKIRLQQGRELGISWDSPEDTE